MSNDRPHTSVDKAVMRSDVAAELDRLGRSKKTATSPDQNSSDCWSGHGNLKHYKHSQKVLGEIKWIWKSLTGWHNFANYICSQVTYKYHLVIVKMYLN